jgi:parallel beta-helix repeat protein
MPTSNVSYTSAVQDPTTRDYIRKSIEAFGLQVSKRTNDLQAQINSLRRGETANVSVATTIAMAQTKINGAVCFVLDERDWYWCDGVTWFAVSAGLAGSGRPYTTRVVAAHDSIATGKANADYVCTGSADNVQVQAALTSLAVTGQVLLLEGTYHLAAQIQVGPNQHLSGISRATCTLVAAGEIPYNIIKILPGGGTMISDLSILVDDEWIEGASAIQSERVDSIDSLVLTNLSIRGTSSAGISLGTCTNTLIENVIVSYCDGDGIYAFDATELVISGCTLHHLMSDGIHIVHMIDSRIFGNRIHTCGECGIRVNEL